MGRFVPVGMREPVLPMLGVGARRRELARQRTQFIPTARRMAAVTPCRVCQ